MLVTNADSTAAGLQSMVGENDLQTRCVLKVDEPTPAAVDQQIQIHN
jgi:hypothetical protein